MTEMTEVLIQHAGASDVAAWLAERLPQARVTRLSAADLARIESYRGRSEDLHRFLPAMPWPAEVVWYEYETGQVAQGGTAMTLN